MSKKIILPIILILLVGLSFVYAQNWAAEMQKRPFENGWNLVYGLMSPDQLDGQLLQKSNIKAIYAFIPTIQEYARAYPNPEYDRLRLIDDDELLQTGFWVYSEQDVDSKYWLLEEIIPVNERTIYQGWNFVGLTSDIVGYTFEESKGNCNIEKSYIFSPMDQRWREFTLDRKIDSVLISQVWVIKVSNDCSLGTVGGNIPSVPQLPSFPSNSVDGVDFPNTIYDGYELQSKSEDTGDCTPDGAMCIDIERAEYRNSETNNVVFAHSYILRKGTNSQLKSFYASQLGGSLDTIMVYNNKLYRIESHEVLWFIADKQAIFIQEGTIVPHESGYSISYGGIDQNNDVLEYLLDNYPSMNVD